MENIMKNFALILCLLLSPLSYASYHEGTGGDSSNGNSGSSGGGYGSGGGGGAAALLAVGALVYFMNRDTEEEETESTFVRRYKESNLITLFVCCHNCSYSFLILWNAKSVRRSNYWRYIINIGYINCNIL